MNNCRGRWRGGCGCSRAFVRLTLCAAFVGLLANTMPQAGHAAPAGPVTLLIASTIGQSAAGLRAARTTGRPQLAIDDYRRLPLRRIHRVTAYCDRGITAAGLWSGAGQCAAPADIPFGSVIYVPSLDRSFVVTDRTAKRFRESTVDIFISDRDACLDFGLNYLECENYIRRDPPRYGSVDLLLATLAHAS